MPHAERCNYSHFRSIPCPSESHPSSLQQIPIPSSPSTTKITIYSLPSLSVSSPKSSPFSPNPISLQRCLTFSSIHSQPSSR